MAAILNIRVFPYIVYCILHIVDILEHASKCRSSETTLRTYAAQLSLQVTILCAAIFVVSPTGDWVGRAAWRKWHDEFKNRFERLRPCDPRNPGNAAEPAASCRNRRRGSVMA